MVFFKNATLTIAALTTTKNKEGTKIKKFDFENSLETFRADVQPNVLTTAQIELYGLDSKRANTKKCFCEMNEGIYMTIDNRVKVVFDDGVEEIYTIQPVNLWRFHKEFLLIPVENESPKTSTTGGSNG